MATTKKPAAKPKAAAKKPARPQVERRPIGLQSIAKKPPLAEVEEKRLRQDLNEVIAAHRATAEQVQLKDAEIARLTEQLDYLKRERFEKERRRS